METAPLNLAHDHARSASKETGRGNASAARAEHEAAAGEFSSASREIADHEALRILKLLEEQHRKLAQVIGSQAQLSLSVASREGRSPSRYNKSSSPARRMADPTAKPGSSEAESTVPQQPLQVQQPRQQQRQQQQQRQEQQQQQQVQASPQPKQQALSKSPSSADVQPSSPSTTPPRQRDSPRQGPVSSSIVAELATARGIPHSQRRRRPPASPTLSAQQAGGKISSLQDGQSSPQSQLRETVSRRHSARRRRPRGEKVPSAQGSAVPAASTETDKAVAEAPVTPAADTPVSAADEPFQKFFSTFEQLFSKLSAPLAYAGLPLNPPASTRTLPPTPYPKIAADRTAADGPAASGPQPLPDVTKYFSKAAMRALRDGGTAGAGGAALVAGGNRGPGSQALNSNESFYFVPKTGGAGGFETAVTALARQASSHSPSHHSQQRQQQQQQRQDHEPHNLTDVAEESGSGSGSFEQFVDASEVPTAPPSPQSLRSRRASLRLRSASSLGLTATQIGATATGTSAVHGIGVGTPRAGSRSGIDAGKTMEELQLENGALRQHLDAQSRRLQMWEASAQSQSQALAQSFRALHEHAGTTTSTIPRQLQLDRPREREGSGVGNVATTGLGATADAGASGAVAGAVAATGADPDASKTGANTDPGSVSGAAKEPSAEIAAADERVRVLEEAVKKAQTEMEACAAENAKFAQENEKLRTVVGRYRDKWEQLKAGARMRRETADGSDTKSSTNGKLDADDTAVE